MIWIYCIPALLLHEMAHIVCALALGLRVKRIGINWRGPYIVRETGTSCQNALITAIGPLMNLALCFFGPVEWRLVNLTLGLSNLIPFGPSDGGRLLKIWRLSRLTQPTLRIHLGENNVQN